MIEIDQTRKTFTVQKNGAYYVSFYISLSDASVASVASVESVTVAAVINGVVSPEAFPFQASGGSKCGAERLFLVKAVCQII